MVELPLTINESPSVVLPDALNVPLVTSVVAMLSAESEREIEAPPVMINESFKNVFPLTFNEPVAERESAEMSSNVTSSVVATG